MSGVLGSTPATKLRSLTYQVFNQNKMLLRVNIVTYVIEITGETVLPTRYVRKAKCVFGKRL